tara:strand:- start:4490 stop:5323 length:834 start_codon:yes stop_codon:yes gene_type:complete
MTNILVTGHKGYIGKHLYRELKRLFHEVDGIDLKDGKDIIHCLPKKSYDYVFHLAALPSVPYSIESPSYTLRNNVLGTSVLLEWAKNHEVKCVIFSSSAAVIGDKDGPKSPYGLHKLMCEMECKLYSKLYSLNTVSLRYFNVYSEDQVYGGPYSSVISAWMEMSRRGNSLKIYGEGDQTRDMIYIKDVIGANIFCMRAHKSGNRLWKGESLNVGTGIGVSINYIKKNVDKHISDLKWSYMPPRVGDIKHSTADITTLQDLGWKPKVSIEEGIEKCFG